MAKDYRNVVLRDLEDNEFCQSGGTAPTGADPSPLQPEDTRAGPPRVTELGASGALLLAGRCDLGGELVERHVPSGGARGVVGDAGSGVAPEPGIQHLEQVCGRDVGGSEQAGRDGLFVQARGVSVSAGAGEPSETRWPAAG